MVEVCTITHPQLERTLEKDLAIIADRFNRLSGTEVGDPIAILGESGDPVFASSTGGPSEDAKARFAAVSKQYPHFDEETFQTIADRLTGFYRKGGKARNFSDVLPANRDGGILPMDRIAGQIPSERVDPQNVTQVNQSAPRMKDREGLQRFVDQWTDSWEYTRMTSHLRTLPRPPGVGTGLFSNYLHVETGAAKAFWNDCDGLWDICQAPTRQVEREACIRCAYKALLNYCIDGKTKDDRSCVDAAQVHTFEQASGTSLWFTQSSFGTSTTIQDPNVNRNQPFTIEGHRDGNTLRNWLMLELLAETYTFKQYRKSDLRIPDQMKAQASQMVALNKFLPWNLKQASQQSPESGDQKTIYDFSDIGRRHFEQLPLSRWQRCYLWSGRVETPVYRGCDELRGKTKPDENDPSCRNAVQLSIDECMSPRPPCADIKGGGDVEGRRRNCRERSSRNWCTSRAADAPKHCGRRLVKTELDTWRNPPGMPAWGARPLFKVAFNHPVAGQSLNYVKGLWTAACTGSGAKVWGFDFRRPTTGAPEAYCTDFDDNTRLQRGRFVGTVQSNIDWRFDTAIGRLAPVPASTTRGGDVESQAGGAIEGALGPVIGFIVGQLIKGDIETVMKTLAKAAGITPEQAVDCEDPEYRYDTMKIGCRQGGNVGRCAPNDNRPCCSLDNKRGCLTKVFAKNFVSALETIIVMIGNRLVDWAVDKLDSALTGVRVALVSAAGSVPFVGGVLAAAVTIAWDLLFQFAVKAGLKSLVVSELPNWLRIKDLAKLDLDELLIKHPIVAVVAGIILDVITQAMAFGNKGPIEVGFGSILNVAESILRRNPTGNELWIRAFVFAKKELLKETEGGAKSIGEQVKGLAKAMMTGVATAISARMSPVDQSRFMAALAKINLDRIIDSFKTDPIGALTNLLAEVVVPVAIPIINAFVEMPKWAKMVLSVLGEAVVKAFDGSPSVPGAVRNFVKELLKTVMVGLTERIPDEGLRNYVTGVWNNVLKILDADGINTFKRDFCNGGDCSTLNATAIAGALKDLVQSLIPVLLNAALGDGPVKTLLSSLFTRGFSLFGGSVPTDAAGMYQALFCTAPPGRAERLADSVTTFLNTQVGTLVQGTGLQQPIAQSLTAFTRKLCTTAPGTFDESEFSGIVRTGVTQLITAAGGSPVEVALANAIVTVAASTTIASVDTLIANIKGSASALGPVKGALVAAVSSRLGNPVGAAFGAVFDSLVSNFLPDGTRSDTDSWGAFRTAANLGHLRAMAGATLGDMIPAAQISAMTFERAVEVAEVIARSLIAALGDGPLARAISRVISGLVSYVQEPSRFPSAADVAEAAAGKIAIIAEGAAQLVEGARRALFDDQDPRGTLFSYGLVAMVKIAKTRITSSSNVAAVAKEQAVGLARHVAGFLHGRIAALVPERLGSLRGLLLDGFYALSRFAVAILEDGYAPAKEALIGTVANLPKVVVSALFEAAEDLVRQAISHRPLRDFVTGLMETLSNTLKSADWPPNVANQSAVAAGLLSDFSRDRLKPFIYDTLGISRTTESVKKRVVDFGFGILFGVLDGNLAAKVTQLTGGDHVAFVKGALGDLLGNFAMELKSTGNKTLGRIVGCSAEFVRTGTTPTECLR